MEKVSGQVEEEVRVKGNVLHIHEACGRRENISNLEEVSSFFVLSLKRF